MTTVPGTYFTKEQLEAALEADKVLDGGYSGSNILNHYGFVYDTEKKQYDKALAWYILAAKENISTTQNNIGILYHYGDGVPQNYLCALKWYLKAAEQNEYENTPNNIGDLFEHGYSVPLDKYKALEWYCHGGDKSHRDRLKKQGYHRSAMDKKKTRQQLIKETEAILDAEKKKLEEKQDKTQEEMEAVVDVNITYKLVDGGKEAWEDVPILFADDKQRYTKLVNNSVTNNDNEILELKQQIQLLKQDKHTFESQAKQLQLLKQEKTNFEHQIKEKDKELVSLRNDKQSLQRGNSTVQQEMKVKDSKINSLQNEKQELKLKINSLEYQLKEKDNKINSLENEIRIHCTSTLAQTQKLETLNHEKTILEQNKMRAGIEMERLKASNITLVQSKQNDGTEIERLKASNTSLEQLLKLKEDATVSLNGENKNLSTANQFMMEMVETQKSFLQAKTNEMELLRQNMERQLADEKRRNDALEQENRIFKQERAQNQTNTQNSTHLNSNNINSNNVGSSRDGDGDNTHNDINYDTEPDNTEESDDDDNDDINYDTPSEDEDK